MADPFFDPAVIEQDLIDLGAERVTYTPAGGAARQVWAIVDRYPPGARGPGGTPSPKARVTAVADPQRGIDPSQLNAAGEDTVTINYPGRNGTLTALPVTLMATESQNPNKRFSVDGDGLARLSLT
jgi:hypothetical protein